VRGATTEGDDARDPSAESLKPSPMRVRAMIRGVTRRRGRSEPDLVSKLHEDARWSMYTNSVVRWPEWVRGGRGLFPRRRDRDFVPFMLVTLLIFGVVGAGVGAIALVVKLVSH
jgi:hypothetical protein